MGCGPPSRTLGPDKVGAISRAPFCLSRIPLPWRLLSRHNGAGVDVGKQPGIVPEYLVQTMCKGINPRLG